MHPVTHSATTAAFFDVDGTLVGANTMIDFHRYYHAQRHALHADDGRSWLHGRFADQSRGVLALLRYAVLGLRRDDRRSVNRAYMRDWRGRSLADFHALVVKWFDDRVRATVIPSALARLRAHQGAGHLVVLISGSPEVLVRPLATLIEVENVIATRLEVLGGRFTGSTLDPWALVGTGKVRAMEGFCAVHGIDLMTSYAYSDHPSDFPMLAAVGHPTVVSPSLRMRRKAALRGFGFLPWAFEGTGGVGP